MSRLARDRSRWHVVVAVLAALFIAGCGPDLNLPSNPVKPDAPVSADFGEYLKALAENVEKGVFTDTAHLGKTMDDEVADWGLKTTSSYDTFRESLKDRKAIDDGLKAELAGKIRSLK